MYNFVQGDTERAKLLQSAMLEWERPYVTKNKAQLVDSALN
jgi:hypothetical protein